MIEERGVFTNNKWSAATGELFSSYNPSTGKSVWKGMAAAKAEVDEVVKNANNAFDSWSNLGLKERYAYLERFGMILKDHHLQMAETISAEMGKPLWESKTEVASMVNKIGLSLEAYEKRCEILFKDHPSAQSITRHRAHGVVAVFGPFNFPGHLPNGHIIPALLAGNTVVFKPSELTPLVAQLMTNYWEQAKLPPGVINMIQGGKKTGQVLFQNATVQGVFFTGSYAVGRTLSEQFGSHPEKILALEMGGNNPLIVTHAIDLNAAAYLTIQSAYLTSGQRCTCARRLIIPVGSQGDLFISNLKKMIKKIKIGYPTEIPEPFMGPLVSSLHAKHVLEAQNDLIDRGGIPLILMEPKGDALLSPGLIDVTQINERQDNEIFGPLLQVIRVAHLKDAVVEANNTKFGLSAGLISSNSDEYSYFYRHIKAGLINWNTPTTGASSGAPFGGVGCSGNHRPSAYFAADYCSYPVASLESAEIKMPTAISPGINFKEG